MFKGRTKSAHGNVGMAPFGQFSHLLAPSPILNGLELYYQTLLQKQELVGKGVEAAFASAFGNL